MRSVQFLILSLGVILTVSASFGSPVPARGLGERPPTPREVAHGVGASAGSVSVSSGAIAGRVLDAATELPLAGATVQCDGRSTTAAADGYYRFGGLPAGEVYTLTASAEFHSATSQDALVEANATTGLDLALSATGSGTIAGRVTDEDASSGIAGALVTCGVLSAVTQADGSYTISDVPAGGAAVVGASAAGYEWGTARDVSVSSGHGTTVNFALVSLPSESIFEVIQYEDDWFPQATGAAWGDYDGDGYADLFLTGSPGGLPNVRLLRNQGDLTFADLGSALRIYEATTGATDGVAWADYDNDGDLDVLVSGDGGVYDKLYLNDGTGFTDAAASAFSTPEPSDPGRTVSWCDYNGDNWLDVFVSYTSYPGYDVRGRLYLNETDGTFTEVTEAAGMGGDDSSMYAIGSHWGDYDNDGWSDLLVASWNLPPMLYRNEGDGTFTEVSATAHVAGLSSGTGAAWGDYDNDGWLDCYVVGRGGVTDGIFHNNGDGTFTNLSGTAGMAGDTFAANGVSWADYDNDGYLDIVLGGDNNTTVVLYHNNGDGTFTNTAASAGLVPTQRSGSTVWADMDLDGRMDLLNAGHPDSVLSHNIGAGGNWLRVRALTDADGDACDADSSDDRIVLGARVEVNVDDGQGFLPGRTLIREIDGGSGFLGQNEPVAHFGVPVDGPVAVRVRFPDGSVVTHLGVSLNQEIVIRDVPADRIVETFADVPLDFWGYEYINACVNAEIVSGYPEGDYKPDQAVNRAQIAVFVSRGLAGGEENVPAPTADPGFTDVGDTHWAYKYICYAVDQNVVTGYPEGDYKPNEEVTRGQMAVYVARAMVAPTSSVLDHYMPVDPQNFPDVPSDHWAYTYVEYCVEHGVVNGYPEGDYRPAKVVTRDQMAVYVARAFDLTS
ncbi:MAG: VCBS repeat-containing protein [Armatimonadetes bacterium]|nr:VCBS repeat-containing protein [Armatimonadota bacterium]